MGVGQNSNATGEREGEEEIWGFFRRQHFSIVLFGPGEVLAHVKRKKRIKKLSNIWISLCCL